MVVSYLVTINPVAVSNLITREMAPNRFCRGASMENGNVLSDI